MRYFSNNTKKNALASCPHEGALAGADDENRTREPHPYQGCALPAELHQRCNKKNYSRRLWIWQDLLTKFFDFFQFFLRIVFCCAEKSDRIGKKRNSLDFSAPVLYNRRSFISDIKTMKGSIAQIAPKESRRLVEAGGQGRGSLIPELRRWSK